MAKPRRLSSLEWEIMKVIWQMEPPVTVRQVLETAYPQGEKAYTTIQTVMNHLVDKGYLQRKKVGLVNFYSPLFSEEDSLVQEVDQFLHRAFSGSLTSLFQFLLSRRPLKPEEIHQLKKLIESKERESGQ